MPALTDAAILANNPSTHAYMPEIHDYLEKELLAGRMSGPFSHAETELILCGPFQSSPLVVSLQPQQCGMPDKVRICQHLSKASKTHASVNSYIHKEDFPMRFDFASKVAEIVSPFFLNSFPSSSILFVIHPFAFCAWGCLLLYCFMQFEIFASLMRYLGHLSMDLSRVEHN